MMRKVIFKALGVGVSVASPLIAVLCYFPLWRERGTEAVLSGFTAFLIVLSVIPIINLLKRMLSSPSAWVMWLISFIIFFALSRIADEMVVISFVGTVSNVIGAILYRIGGSKEKDNDEA